MGDGIRAHMVRDSVLVLGHAIRGRICSERERRGGASRHAMRGRSRAGPESFSVQCDSAVWRGGSGEIGRSGVVPGCGAATGCFGNGHSVVDDGRGQGGARSLVHGGLHGAVFMGAQPGAGLEPASVGGAGVVLKQLEDCGESGLPFPAFVRGAVR